MISVPQSGTRFICHFLLSAQQRRPESQIVYDMSDVFRAFSGEAALKQSFFKYAAWGAHKKTPLARHTHQWEWLNSYNKGAYMMMLSHFVSRWPHADFGFNRVRRILHACAHSQQYTLGVLYANHVSVYYVYAWAWLVYVDVCTSNQRACKMYILSEQQQKTRTRGNVVAQREQQQFDLDCVLLLWREIVLKIKFNLLRYSVAR